MEKLKRIGWVLLALVVLTVLGLAGYTVWDWCHDLPGPPSPFPPPGPGPVPPPNPGPHPTPPVPPVPPGPEVWHRGEVIEVQSASRYRVTVNGREGEFQLAGYKDARLFDRRGRQEAEQLIGPGRVVSVRFAVEPWSDTGWIRTQSGVDLAEALTQSGWLKPLKREE